MFSSVSLTDCNSPVCENTIGNEAAQKVVDVGRKFVLRRRGAMNSTKHLWAGAVAAMVTSFRTSSVDE